MTELIISGKKINIKKINILYYLSYKLLTKALEIETLLGRNGSQNANRRD